MRLSAHQIDRACGVLLATAAGDALGAGYEFGPPLAPHDERLWLGDIGALRSLPADVDAVVSLCRVADDDAPAVPADAARRLTGAVGRPPAATAGPAE